MHYEVDLYAVGFVDGESTAIVIVSHAKFLAHVLDAKNVSYGVGMIPNVAIILYVCFPICSQGASVAVDCHGVVDFPGAGDEFPVTKEVASGLIVEQN